MPEDQTHDAFPHSLHGTAFPSREGGQAIRLETAGGMSLRALYAGQVLAGLVSNPSIIAPNGMNGWGLVNCKEADLCAFADHLAAHLVELCQ